MQYSLQHPGAARPVYQQSYMPQAQAQAGDYVQARHPLVLHKFRQLVRINNDYTRCKTWDRQDSPDFGQRAASAPKRSLPGSWNVPQ